MFQGSKADRPLWCPRAWRAWAIRGRVASSRGASFSNSSLLLKPSAVFTCDRGRPCLQRPCAGTDKVRLRYALSPS